jgi:hypothetical protein
MSVSPLAKTPNGSPAKKILTKHYKSPKNWKFDEVSSKISSPDSIAKETKIQYNENHSPEPAYLSEMLRYTNRQSALKTPQKRNKNRPKPKKLNFFEEHGNKDVSPFTLEEIPDEFANGSPLISETFEEKEPFRVIFPKNEKSSGIFGLQFNEKSISSEENQKIKVLKRENSTATTSTSISKVIFSSNFAQKSTIFKLRSRQI